MINTSLKLKLSGLAILAAIIIVFIGVITFSTFSNQQANQSTLPTPTSVPTQPVVFDHSHITPLQKTTIGQTTDNQIIKNESVTSKTTLGDITIYKVKSIIPGMDDEIRTKNGKVIFESTSTEIATPLPPTMAQVKSTFGEPEVTMPSVGVGWYTSGYLYPSQGVAIFANTSTGTVYLVQRFTPMTLANYQRQYAEFLQTQKSQPEYFK